MTEISSIAKDHMALMAPMDNGGVRKWIVQFNKFTKVIFAVHAWHENPALSEDKFLYRVVEYDQSEYALVGDYDTLEIVPRADLPVVVVEADLDELAAGTITDVYSEGRQLNILAEAIAALGTHAGVDLPELNDMIAEIKEIRERNQRRKDSYEKNPSYEYKSYETVNQELAALLEGGMHEEFGARRLVETPWGRDA